jgi:hypothetical protein
VFKSSNKDGRKIRGFHDSAFVLVRFSAEKNTRTIERILTKFDSEKFLLKLVSVLKPRLKSDENKKACMKY